MKRRGLGIRIVQGFRAQRSRFWGFANDIARSLCCWWLQMAGTFAGFRTGGMEIRKHLGSVTKTLSPKQSFSSLLTDSVGISRC